MHVCLGVPEAERASAQKVLVSVEMETDASAPAATDDITHTIDYHAVAKRLTAMTAGRNFKLIETMAVQMAELVLREFKPKRVVIEIKKFILPNTKHVAVRVVRPAR